MQKFTTHILILTTALLAIAVALFGTVLSQWYLPIYPWIFVFLLTETLLVHYILAKAAVNKRAITFNNYYLLSTMGKMFLNLIFIGIYIYINKVNAIPFAIVFLVLYFIYTAFEVPAILNHISKIK